MITPSLSIMRRILANPRRKLNILTTPTHEGQQTLIDKTGHNFYMVGGRGFKPWDFHTKPLPPNHYLYGAQAEEVKADVEFDLVLCQNRGMTFPFLQAVSQKLNIPLIVLDHTEPPPGLTGKKLDEIKSWIGNQNVYITEHNKTTWGNPNGIVIPHGIDTEIFRGYTGEIASGISIVNQFANRDIFCGWNLWNAIKNTGVPCDLIGENPGLSKSINNTEELVAKVSKYRFYLNTSQYSPIPLSVLEAMAIGLPIVTTAKQELPKIIENGVNGFISNNPEELVKYCNILLQDHELARQMGAQARKTIEEKFSLANFIQNWNEVFYNTIQEIA